MQRLVNNGHENYITIDNAFIIKTNLGMVFHSYLIFKFVL